VEIAPNIFLIYKPTGITSHDAIVRAKKLLGAKKIGHAGTLDPLAEGLLVVGVNEGTKKIAEYVGLPKTYEATVRVGVRTDTGDITGSILEEASVSAIAERVVRSAVASLVGVHRLRVPQYSAVKVGGRKLYELARSGRHVPEVMRDMEVMEAVYHGHTCKGGVCDVSLTVVVASGVYVRSLAGFLGERLGYPATLKALRRTRVGEWSVEGALHVPGK